MKPTPIVASAAGPVANAPMGQMPFRTTEQEVARMIYYAMTSYCGVPTPPRFSSLYVQTQQMYVSVASSVLRQLEAMMVEE
jgi:hypothetical protein